VNKACPHCHQDSFGWRELIVLGAFTPVKCKHCHQLVRNSGWRQVLAAIISLLAITIWLSDLLRPDLGVFLIPVAVIVVPTVLVLLAKPIKADVVPLDPSPFTPNPDNDKLILSQGWSEDELRQILNDFVDGDISAFAAFRVELEQRSENTFSLFFPEDVHPGEFLSLINYLAYPVGFDQAGRQITVFGTTTLNSDFDGLPKSAEGKKAILYLPENDVDHDLVYLQTDRGRSLARSLDQGVWRPVANARLSSAVRSLAQ
jgi:hypothetical protein